jgi:ATP-dependent protease ClpP protease subunit
MLLTGKTLDRDSYFSPEEAQAWGLIDEVIAKRPKETTITE